MRWVLSCVLALAACTESPSTPDESCEREIEQTLTVAIAGDAPLELRAESCRRDVDACPQLCTFILERAGGNTFTDRCEVTLATDNVTVTYARTQWGCW